MAEDKGKIGSDDQSPEVGKEGGKESKKDIRSDERKDYAKEMWNKIKKTNASKKKRGDLKEGLDNSDVKKEGRAEIKEAIVDGEEVKPKKKRRRRRRKKKPIEEPPPVVEVDFKDPKDLENSDSQVENVETFLQPSPVSPVAPEPPVPPVVPVAPVAPVAPEPINPFAPADGFKKPAPTASEAFLPTVDLPPQDYEDRYQMEANDEGGQDDDSDDVDLAEGDAGSTEPINPFAPQSSSKKHSESALDDRTLEKKSAIKEGTEAMVDETESAEEIKQTNDVSDVTVEVEGTTEDNVVLGENKETTETVEAEVVESKPIDVEEVPGHVEMAANEAVKVEGVDEFKEDFWEILEQAGLTKKRIIVFVVALVLGVVFLIFFVFNRGGDGSEDQPGETDENVVESSEDGVPTEIDLGTVPYEIVSSYIFGLEYGDENHVPIEADPINSWADEGGIESALILGDQVSMDRVEFVEFTELIRDMENIFDTDVYSLVNSTTDRTERLDEHIGQMLALIEDGEAAVLKIDANLEALNLKFETVALDRDTQEAAFFDSLDQLYGQNAYESLEEFIELSRSTQQIRAVFEANQALREKFINALTVLIPRYEDILANKEALVKGVRVFDVPGSDIEAIQPFN
jgi:hypothetical protein